MREIRSNGTGALLLCLLALGLSGCAGGKDIIRSYVITTSSSYTCCRMINYQVTDFTSVRPAEGTDAGVTVRLLGDTLIARCDVDAVLPLVIANNTSNDIFVPISRELDGERLKLYPWRLLYQDRLPVRLARQIQFGDLVERTDGQLLFHRLPAGKEVRLQGVIPAPWVCAGPTPIPEGYLERELDPTYYADYSRSLRDASARYAKMISPVGLRFDVAYTRLDVWNSLPGVVERSSGGGDTTYIDIDVKEIPSSFLNSSQQVAESNVIQLRHPQ